jgi:hypothetical protein
MKEGTLQLRFRAVKRQWQGVWAADLGGATGVLRRRRPSIVHRSQGGPGGPCPWPCDLMLGPRCCSCSRPYRVEEDRPEMPPLVGDL